MCCEGVEHVCFEGVGLTRSLLDKDKVWDLWTWLDDGEFGEGL